MKKGYKECPFCANEIKVGARKCQYCKEFLPEKVIDRDKEEIAEKFNKKKHWNKIKLIVWEKQLYSCVAVGNKWISKYSLIFMLRMPGLIIFELDYLINWEKINTWVSLATFLVFLLLVGIVYYFIWLVKNYKVLFNSKINWLVHNSYFNLVLCWVCPVLNLYKPQHTLDDLLNNMVLNQWVNYNKNITKHWQILWNITVISFALINWLWIYASVIFMIFNIIQVIKLKEIVKLIVHSQELRLENK